MRTNNNYYGNLCDPSKAIHCTKTTCYYCVDENGKRKGGCRYTTNPEWFSDKKGVQDDE